MPERQSAPGEASARPETDLTERGDDGTGEGGAGGATAAAGPARTPTGAPGAEDGTGPAGEADGAAPADTAEPGAAGAADAAPEPDGTAATTPMRPDDPDAPTGAAPVTAPASAAAPAPEPARPAPEDPVPAAPPPLPTRVPARPVQGFPADSPGGAALFEPPDRPEPADAPGPTRRDESPTVRTPRNAPAPVFAPPPRSAGPDADAAQRTTAVDRGDGGDRGDRADRGDTAPDPSADRTTAVPAAAGAVARPRPGTAPSTALGTGPSTAPGTGDRPPADESPTVAVRAGGRPSTPAARPEPAEQATTALRRPGPAAADAAGADAPTQRLQRATPTRDAERTTVAPAPAPPTVAAPAPVGPPPDRADEPYGGGPFGPDGPQGPDGPDARPRRRRRPWLPIAVGLGVLGALYGGDLALSSGSVPRGVTVAGQDIGGLPVPEAEQQLRTAIEPRTTQPIAVTLGDAASEIDPAKAGLSVDWAATLDQVGSQPLNPVTRVTSFFTEREVDVVTAVDRPALDSALGELSPILDKEPVEGTVEFEGTTPVPVQPVAGQHLDVPAAGELLRTDWVRPGPIALPVVVEEPVTTAADVERAITEVAEPAVSAPLTVVGEDGAEGTVEPEVIAEALSFRGEPGGLVPEVNQQLLIDELTPQLAASERPGRDASIDFSSGRPVVTPSQDGRGIDYEATLKEVVPVLTGTGEREITAVYAEKPAELTTDELNGLGISGVIGEFQTGGFAQDSGQNIKRAAEVINGMVVLPGETFSLNEATSPRNASNGYVEAGIIDNGRAGRGIGGGVSQVATTLYNAAYFAGMVDVEHKEHSFYISRYPAGREATVFEGSIDMKFRNDNPTGVMIQTEWTPTSLTVRLYGTKRYEVTSSPGPRTNPTTPSTVTVPAGERCVPSNGAPGFTITDTRTLKEIATGEVRTETRTVKYNPVPIVNCTG